MTSKADKVLLIIPFKSVYPPTSGGKQRCLHVLRQLSIHFDLTVISNIDFNEIEKVKSDYKDLSNVSFRFIDKNIDIPFFWKLFPKKMVNSLYYRFISRSLFKSSKTFLLEFYNTTINLVKTEQFDFIIHENLDSIDLARIIKRKFPELIQVYDAYNFDSELAEYQYLSGFISKREFSEIRLSESTLHEHIDILWTCSQREKELFRTANQQRIGQIDVIPNGTEIINLKTNNLAKEKNEILFVGSLDYYPNEEGLIWFIKKVAPLINTDFKLKIIGSGKLSIELSSLASLNKNIHLIGFVDSLDDYYLNADIVIIPIISGSGTRLKALEAMKFQKAIISTSKGIEGIDIKDEVIILDDPKKMAKVITELLNNCQLRIELGIKAMELVKKSYDWNIIGNEIKRSLEICCKNGK